jgi:hypothetical protein
MLFKNDERKWRYSVLIFIGLFLIANAFSFDHQTDRVVASDTVIGAFVIILSFLGLYSAKQWIDWALAFIAAYLLLAPILLWAPQSMSYQNDEVLAALIFTFAVLFSNHEREQDDNLGVPLGWNYNPSAFSQRLPVITLAFFAYLFSRYMALYQLGYISTIIDPVFGDGTHAGLGSWVYGVEVLMGIHGSRKRWFTIPWFVTFFAILVVPAGLVSVLLITLQPLIVGSYCFWCLITALAMLFMIAFAVDEVVATLLFLGSVRRRGGDVKKAFWHGDASFETKEETRGVSWFRKTFFGVSFPWTLVVSALIGFGMMFFQNKYQPDPHLQSIEATIGALVMTFSIISFGEVIRSFRYINIILGIIFAIFAMYGEGVALYYHIIIGVLLILLAIPKGKMRFSYGEWNKYIF